MLTKHAQQMSGSYKEGSYSLALDLEVLGKVHSGQCVACHCIRSIAWQAVMERLELAS